MSYKYPEDAAAYNERSFAGGSPMENLMSFLRIHEVLSHKASGVAASYTHTLLDTSTPGVTISILYNIPPARFDHLYSLIVSVPSKSRIYLSEHVAANKNAKLFFDLDFSLDIVTKANIKSTAAVRVFDQLTDLFIEHVEICIRQAFAAQSSDDEEEVPCTLKMEALNLMRTYNKRHIIFPYIRCDKKSMVNLHTAIVKSLSAVQLNEVITLPDHHGTLGINVDWKKSIDGSVYKDFHLRMLGSTSSDKDAKESVAHLMAFPPEEVEDGETPVPLLHYRRHYLLDEKPVNEQDLALTSIHCGVEPKEQRANFVMLSKTDTERMESQNCAELFKDHIEDVIQRRVRDTLYTLRTTTSDVFTNVEIDPTMIECKQLSQTHYAAYTKEVSEVLDGDCYAATLAIQSCPFAKRLHNRCLQGRSPLVCLVFSRHLLLRCHKCTELDPSARLVLPIQRQLGEVDMLHQLQMAKDALMMRTDAQLASVIFNWVRDRNAACVIPGKQRAYKYFYFDQDQHCYREKDTRVVQDVMEPDGIVQTKFAEICRMIGKASSGDDEGAMEDDDEDEDGGLADVGKRNSVKKLLLKLNKRLQSSGIQTSVIPLIGRKLSDYYQEKDIAKRPFEKQLDDKAWLLCCANGVIDFREGARLRPGRPDDMLSINTNMPYIAWDALLPELKKEVLELFETIFPIKEERDYITWCYARSLNGDRRRQVIYFEYGQGSDGKSVLFSIFKKMLGDYYAELPTAMIFGMDSNTSGPRSDLMFIQKRRVVAFMEPNAKDKMINGVVKLVSGGDSISASEKFERHCNFKPQCAMFVLLNNRAVIEGSPLDHGLWRRVAYHLFRHRFVTDESEITNEQYCSVGMSEDKVTEYTERMALGVFSYLIHIYQNTKKDIKEPEALTEIARTTRAENDLYLRYITERIEPMQQTPEEYVAKQKLTPEERVLLNDKEEGQHGIKVFDLWAPFKDWLKSRGFSIKGITIARFEEFIGPYLKKIYLPHYMDVGYWMKWKDRIDATDLPHGTKKTIMTKI